MMTPEEKAAAMAVLKALTDTIREAPDGAPLGPMYMAFQMRGMSLDTFMGIIGQLEELGVVKVSNHCAYWVAGRMQ